MMLANSVRFALPRITAPAARSRLTTVASSLARAFSEGERACGGVLLVAGGDVVLDQDRHAGQRLARRRFYAVELGGDRQRVGIDLAHGIEARSAPVVGFDARQIGAGQGTGGDLSCAKGLGHVGERGVLDGQAGLSLGAP